ncbi:hypothetical protein LINPERHAP1_LOCUS5802 [Linum perenne]
MIGRISSGNDEVVNFGIKNEACYVAEKEILKLQDRVSLWLILVITLVSYSQSRSFYYRNSCPGSREALLLVLMVCTLPDLRTNVHSIGRLCTLQLSLQASSSPVHHYRDQSPREGNIRFSGCLNGQTFNALLNILRSESSVAGPNIIKSMICQCSINFF